MRVLLINDTSSSQNWGARATSFALKRMISSTGNHSITAIKQDNTILDKNNPNSANKSKGLIKLLLPPIIIDFKKKYFPKLSFPNNSRNIPQKWENFEKYLNKVTSDGNIFQHELEAIQQAEVVVIQGEGCLRDNTFQSRMMLFLGFVAKKHFGKPVLMVNHTADFSHPALFKIAENVYPLFDDVVFREPTSAKRCKSFCSGRIGADAAFTFEPINHSHWLPLAKRDTYFDFWPDTACFDPAKPYICIGGGSGLPSVSDDRYDPIAKYSTLITYLQKHLPHQIVLTASGSADLYIFRSLATKFNLPLLGSRIPVQQAVDILGNTAAYIGGRWHPSIFALSGGAPIIPLTANTFKMEALSKLFGLTNFTIDPENIDKRKGHIVDLLKDYIKQGESLRMDLKEKAQKESKKAMENVAFFQKDKISNSSSLTV